MDNRGSGYWVDEKAYVPSKSITYCSKCGEIHRYRYRAKYCDQCGTKMVGVRAK